MTTKLSLRDSHTRFLCMRLLQKGGGGGGGGGGGKPKGGRGGGGGGGGGGVEDRVIPKGRSDEGVPPGSLRPFIIRRYSRGKLTRVAVNQPPSC